MSFGVEEYTMERFIFVQLLLLCLAANSVPHVAAVHFNKTCGEVLELDCGPQPIVLISVTSKDRFDEACRPGHEGSKVTIEEVRQQCQGRARCDFQTGFKEEDLRYLGVYYDCGRSYDMCSDVTIRGKKSYLNLLGRAGIPGPATCTCEASVTPGTEVVVQIRKREFRSAGTTLTLKWRDDVTLYVDQEFDTTAPIRHIVTDHFKIIYDTDSGNDELQLSYNSEEPITMVCNKGSKPPLPAPGPRPTTGPGQVIGQNTTGTGTVRLGKELEEGNSPIGAIVGAVVALLLVALIVFLIVFFVIRKRRAQNETTVRKDSADDEAFYETLTKKPGEQNGGDSSKTVPKDEAMYDSITKYKQGGSENKPRYSAELPQVAHARASQTPSFRMSESEGVGDYTDIIEDDEEDPPKKQKSGNQTKGFLGWFGRKFGRGAKQSKPHPSPGEGTKGDSKKDRSTGEQGLNDSQAGNYNVLRHPLLKKPDEFMPEKSGGANYDHVDPNYDRRKGEAQSDNLGEVGDTYEDV